MASQDLRNDFAHEDVVSYLECVNNKHIALKKQLAEEIESLRQRFSRVTEDTAAGSTRDEQIASLKAERDELVARIADIIEEARTVGELAESVLQEKLAEYNTLRVQLEEAKAARAALCSSDTEEAV